MTAPAMFIGQKATDEGVGQLLDRLALFTALTQLDARASGAPRLSLHDMADPSFGAAFEDEGAGTRWLETRSGQGC